MFLYVFFDQGFSSGSVVIDMIGAGSCIIELFGIFETIGAERDRTTDLIRASRKLTGGKLFRNKNLIEMVESSIVELIA